MPPLKGEITVRPLMQARERAWSVGDFVYRESLKAIGATNAPLVAAAADRVLLVAQCTAGGPAGISTLPAAVLGLDGFQLTAGQLPWELRIRDHPGLVQAEWILLGGGAGNVNVLEVFYRPRR